MKKRSTNELQNALINAASIDDYIKEAGDSIIGETLPAYLDSLLAKHNITKSQVIQRANLQEIYGYQIFSGVRKPSRNKLIAISFGFQLSLDDTQSLLKFAGFAPLYPKSKRDSIIIWSITHGEDLIKLNEVLYNQDLPLI